MHGTHPKSVLLEDVQFRDAHGIRSYAAAMQIRARQVYYISLPSDWDVAHELHRQVQVRDGSSTN